MRSRWSKRDCRRAMRVARMTILSAALLAVAPSSGSAQSLPEAAPPDWQAIAKSLLHERRLGPAEELIRRLLAQAEREHGRDAAETAAVLDLLVECLWRKGSIDDEKALALARRAVELKKTLYGQGHLEVSSSLFNLGVILAKAGDLQAADSVFTSVLATRRARLPRGHPEILSAVNALANAKTISADYMGVVDLCRTALREAEVAGTHLSSPAVTIKGALAGALWQVGQVREARSLREALVAHYDSTGHPSLSGALNDLANTEVGSGDYARAAQLYRRALELEESRAGPTTPWAFNIRSNLATTLIRMGEYAAARRLLEHEALHLAADGPWAEQRVRACARRAHLAAELGDREEELELRRQALRQAEESFPPDHDLVAEALFNLGATLGTLGRVDEQEPLVRRAQETWAARLGPGHRFLADCHLALGAIARKRGDLNEARRQIAEALRVAVEQSGEGSIGVAATLADQAAVAREEGLLDEARHCLRHAQQVLSPKVGTDHPLMAEHEADLAIVELAAGRRAAAIEHAFSAERVVTPHLRLTVRALPERQALLVAGQSATLTDILLSLLDEGDPDPTLISQVWDAIIRTRALAFDELAARVRRDRSPADSTRKTDGPFEDHQRASARLANLIVRGPQSADPEVYRDLVADARRDLEEAERALADAGELEGAGSETTGLSAVTDALPDGVALVAYARYRRVGSRGLDPSGERYRAFVLPEGGGAPVSVDIGNAVGVDALIADWRAEISLAVQGSAKHGAAPGSVSSADGTETGRILREAIWDPVLPSLGAAELVLIVPDGAIHLVNIAALPDEARGFLIEAPVMLHHLTAEREVAGFLHEPASGHGALIVGGPDFDRRSSGPRPPAPEWGEGRVLTALDPFREVRPDCLDLGATRFPSLTASKREAREVADLWRKLSLGTSSEEEASRGTSSRGSSSQGSSSRPALPGESGDSRSRETILLMGREATEEAVKRSASGRRLLHLATHGYVLDPACSVDPVSPSRAAGQDALASAGVGANPLLLSGLALAGANRREEAAPNDDDGILTAQEVAAIDLQGVEWAVLSACHSRGSRILRGEGVFGLQRAFQLAGARRVVATLWPVGDEAARAWMRAFYEAILEKGLGTAAAVRDADLTLLRDQRRRGEDPQPFYWGGFVASGDWR